MRANKEYKLENLDGITDAGYPEDMSNQLSEQLEVQQKLPAIEHAIVDTEPVSEQTGLSVEGKPEQSSATSLASTGAIPTQIAGAGEDQVASVDSIDRMLHHPAEINSFKDAQGRDIISRQYGDGNFIQLRAYDTALGTVPEAPNLGTAGMANLHVVTSDGLTQVKLQDIVIPPDYRNSSIAGNILDQTVEIAKAKDASEIYGVIENDEALSYWKHMEEKGAGWEVDSSKGVYGHVRYELDKQASLDLKLGNLPSILSSDIPVSSSIPGMANSNADQLTVGEIQEARDVQDAKIERELQKDLKAFKNNNRDESIALEQNELDANGIRSVIRKTIENANDIKDLDSKMARRNLYQKISIGELAEQLCYESTGAQNLNELIPNFPWADGATPTELQQVKSHINTSFSGAMSAYANDLSTSLGVGEKSTIDEAADKLWELRSTEKWSALSSELPPELIEAENKEAMKLAMLDKVTLRIPAEDVPRLQEYVRENALKVPEKYGLKEISDAEIKKLTQRIKPIALNIKNHQMRLMARDIFQTKMEIAGYPRGIAYAKHLKG